MSKLDVVETVTIHGEVTVRCHGCGRLVRAGLDGNGCPIILHVDPLCSTFEDLAFVDDASDFLELCRARQN